MEDPDKMNKTFTSKDDLVFSFFICFSKDCETENNLNSFTYMRFLDAV